MFHRVIGVVAALAIAIYALVAGEYQAAAFGMALTLGQLLMMGVVMWRGGHIMNSTDTPSMASFLTDHLAIRAANLLHSVMALSSILIVTLALAAYFGFLESHPIAAS